MDVCDQPTGATKTYQQKVSLLLYKVGDNRVGMRLMNGTQPNTREFEGDFEAIARELEPLRSGGTWKTERDWDIELCRVAGGPVILRLENPQPPTSVVYERNPPGSEGPGWLRITYDGSSEFPPRSEGTRKLPGFHRYRWSIRAGRPGFVKLSDPFGNPLVAPLEKAEYNGLFEASYILELEPVNDGTTEVRRVLGPQKHAMQVAVPYQVLVKQVDESKRSANPDRGTPSTLHRYGPDDRLPVTATVTDLAPETNFPPP